MKQFALFLSIILFTCFTNASDQKPDCRSWWSEKDGIRHCLLSGNDEDVATVVQPKNTTDVKDPPTEEITYYNDSPQNQKYDLPPEDILTEKGDKIPVLPNFRKQKQ